MAKSLLSHKIIPLPLDIRTISYYNTLMHFRTISYLLYPLNQLPLQYKDDSPYENTAPKKEDAMHSYTSKEIKRYNHLISEMDAVYHEISLKFGLSDSALIILYTICEHGDSCLLRDICRSSGRSKQTINSAIRKLEADNIVYLEPAGAKNKNVRLTEKGKKLAGNTALKIIDAENQIFASWPKKDVEKYLELTERFLGNLQEKADELDEL